LLVGQAHGEPVDLGLDHVVQRLAFQDPSQPRVKLAQFGLGIGVVETLHRLPVPVGFESLRPIIAHSFGRRLAARKLRKLRLEIRQGAFQLIVIKITDLRLRLPMIQFIVLRHFGTKFGDFLLRGFRSHREGFGTTQAGFSTRALRNPKGRYSHAR
jgi:hypothetical protein